MVSARHAASVSLIDSRTYVVEPASATVPVTSVRQVDVARLDHQLATIGHRVAGVDRHVEQRATELIGIGFDGCASGAARTMSSMCSPIDRRSIVSICATTVLRLMHFGLEHRLPAEREQLSGHRCRAVAGLTNLLEVVARRLLVLVGQQHVGVTGNHRQQVVEVVGDAAGQLTERLHLLRLQQLLLQLPPGVFRDDAIVDVAAGQLNRGELAVGIEDAAGRPVRPSLLRPPWRSRGTRQWRRACAGSRR